jgi:RNA 2',3'-cyclic 3'-phosphodiesterase
MPAIEDGPSGRLFVGVPLPDGVRAALTAHLRATLGAGGLPGRAVPSGNWHLTLRFLGATEPTQGESLVAALRAAELGERFAVTFGGAGAFPSARRAAVFWIGVEEGEDGLRRLAAAAEAAARAAGFPAEERPYRPHLTVARIRPPADVTCAVERVGRTGVRMDVGEVVVFRSHLGGGPARYEAAARLPLR